MITTIKHISATTIVGHARITESIADLEKTLSYTEDLSRYHPKKKEEFLASRALVEQLCNEHGQTYEGLWKDEHGKPHLKNSKLQLSISHSHPWIACMISDKPCGIDIESERPQLLKIRHKYLSDDEYAYCGQSLDNLCKFWAAKEAIYKIYGRMYLSFREHIRLSDQDDLVLATVRHGTDIEYVNLTHEKIKDYHLVYGTL